MRVLLAAALFCTAGCGACEPDRTPPPAGSATPSVSAPVAAPPPPLASHLPAHAPPPPKLACRVVSLDGDAHLEVPGSDAGATPLLLQGLAPTDAWVVVASNARFVARDPKTTRETTFRGPARVRACVGYAEESWLASGTFQSSVGSGEAPGAEEWVVTPSAILRYTAAQVSVEVHAHEADVVLQGGTAFAWQPATAADAGGLEEGWLRLPTGKTRLGGGRDEPVAATLDRCSALSASARSLAAQVMAPGPPVDGGVIAQQVTTRRLARAACAMASLRVNALPPAEAAPLLRPLADANTAWSTLPFAPP